MFHADAQGFAKAALAVALVGAAFSMPPAASANFTGYFQSPPVLYTGVANRKSDLTRTLLWTSAVDSYCDTCRIWAGAHPQGSNSLYGSWAEGYGYACHSYNTNNIGAMIEAPYVAQNIFLALSGWSGGNTDGRYC